MEECGALNSQTETENQEGWKACGRAKEAVGWDAVRATYRMPVEDAAPGVLCGFNDAQVFSVVGEAGGISKDVEAVS